jgi:hypothetical protein
MITSVFDPRPANGRRRKSLAQILSRYKVAENGCHEWTGSQNGHGYGLVCLKVAGRVTTYSPHRLQWMHTRGEIPEGMEVLLTCKNRLCIHEDHLELGTPEDRLDEMHASGRGNYDGLNYSGPACNRRYHRH